MNTNFVLSMVASFLLPVLLLAGFLIAYKKTVQGTQQGLEVRANLVNLTEETNALLREILAELKQRT